MNKVFLFFIILIVTLLSLLSATAAPAVQQLSDDDMSLSLVDGVSLFSSQNDEEAILSCSIENADPCYDASQPIDTDSAVEEGTAISFETVDLDGNPVKSVDLFAQNKMTMLSIWSTGCNFCISEMPELTKLNKDFNDEGAQIIGIVYDADEDDLIEEAKDIVADLGVDYLNLLPNQEIRDIFQTQSFPVTYFINEKGEIVGDPIFGARVSKYSEMLASYLSDNSICYGKNEC